MRTPGLAASAALFLSGAASIGCGPSIPDEGSPSAPLSTQADTPGATSEAPTATAPSVTPSGPTGIGADTPTSLAEVTSPTPLPATPTGPAETGAASPTPGESASPSQVDPPPGDPTPTSAEMPTATGTGSPPQATEAPTPTVEAPTPEPSACTPAEALGAARGLAVDPSGSPPLGRRPEANRSRAAPTTGAAPAARCGDDDAFAGPYALEDAPVALLGSRAGDQTGSAAALVTPSARGQGAGLLLGIRGWDEGGSNTGRVAFASLSELTGCTPVASLRQGYSSPSAWSDTGYALAVGDLTGDGAPELVVGVPGSQATAFDAGEVLIFLGSEGGWDLSAPDARILGQRPDERLGSAVAVAPDTDGDGVDDLLIGAISADRGDTQATGAVYLVSGPISPGVGPLPAHSPRITGGQGGDLLGTAVVGLGDVDGDGLGDVLIGAPGADIGGHPDCGAAYLLRGPLPAEAAVDDVATATLYAPSPFAYTGAALAAPGDLTGDGRPDLVISAPNFTTLLDGAAVGAVFLARAGIRGLTPLNRGAVALVGVQPEGAFGHAAAAAGDVNGDGQLDLIVGAPYVGADEEGAAYLFHGPISGDRRADEADGVFTCASPSCYAGVGVGGGGDLDRDGLDDVWVGASGFTTPDSRGGATLLFLSSAAR